MLGDELVRWRSTLSAYACSRYNVKYALQSVEVVNNSLYILTSQKVILKIDFMCTKQLNTHIIRAYYSYFINLL